MGVLMLLVGACSVDECPRVEPGAIPTGSFAADSSGEVPAVVTSVTLTDETVTLTVEGDTGPYEVTFGRTATE